MSDTSRTSTLFATERAMRSRVLACCAATTIGSVALLAYALSHAPLPWWLACTLAALTPVLSNAHYLRTHSQTTVGMIPVALAGLLPSCACAATSAPASSALRMACIGATVILLTLATIFAWWFWRLRRTYTTRPAVEPGACLIVLGGAIKHGRPCRTLVRRLDTALGLWRQNPGLTIVVTGGPTPDGRTTEAREMARYLRKRGVPNTAIIQEPTARNTRENIERSHALLAKRNFAGQLCVVSSDYHLWRACRDARTIGVSLTPIAAPTPTASIPQQWSREVLTILSSR